jgi:hypothetical protein
MREEVDSRARVLYLGDMGLRDAIIVSSIAFLGCSLISPPDVPIDRGVTFAAHTEHGRIVLDRLPEGGRGEIAPPGLIRWGGAPTFVVTRDRQAVADLWLTAPATVAVKPPHAAEGTASGGVDPAWEDNAVRFTLRRPTGPALRSDLFSRATSGGGPPALSRVSQTTVDVRGTYRASLRDPGGAEVGWLRVRITPYQEASRIFDGVLPADLGTGLAAGLVVALGSEIDWIEAHTLDVNRGSMSDGPLQQSVPMGR